MSPQPQQQRPTSAWGNIAPQPPALSPQQPTSNSLPTTPLGVGGPTLQPPNYPNSNSFGSLTQSFADLSFSSPQPGAVPQQQQQQPPRRDPSPEKGPPSVVAPLPTIASLTSSASSIATSSDPASKVKWAKDVLALVDRTAPASKSKAETSGSKITDPDLVRLTDMAIQHIMNIAGNVAAGGPIPRFVAEALYLRGGLYSTGSFPNYLQKDPRLAFKDYETAARAGFSPAWFKLGRDYESVGDLGKAKECFDLGVSLNETGSLYVSCSVTFDCSNDSACSQYWKLAAPWNGQPPRSTQHPQEPPTRHQIPPPSCRPSGPRHPSTRIRLRHDPPRPIRPSRLTHPTHHGHLTTRNSTKPRPQTIRSQTPNRASRVLGFRSSAVQARLGLRIRSNQLFVRPLAERPILFLGESAR